MVKPAYPGPEKIEFRQGRTTVIHEGEGPVTLDLFRVPEGFHVEKIESTPMTSPDGNWDRAECWATFIITPESYEDVVSSPEEEVFV